MSGFRLGLVIGGLVVAVVALAIAVVVLATDDDGGGDGGDGGGETTEAADDGPCLIPYGDGGEAELDLRTSDLDCDEASEIQAALEERDGVGLADSFDKPVREQGWACVTHPLALHPLLQHCSAPRKRFLVLSLAPTAHTGDPPPPTLPPTGTELECGNLVESGAGTYNVRGNGVDCARARQMAAAWEAVCFGLDQGPDPCPVIQDFSCSSTQTGYELSSIQCTAADRAVTFENGA